MLFFINNAINTKLPMVQFKYISCYSLSMTTATDMIRHTDSNTSHVILYRPDMVIRPDSIDNIQIHLMLFFIALILKI